MTLSKGDKLGHYEIVAPAGAGGMGEVYKARDTGSNAPSLSRFSPRTAIASSAKLAP